MTDRSLLRQRLTDGLRTLGVALPSTGVERLLDYVDLLLRWNSAYNLTAVRDPAQIIDRHLLDSLAIAAYVQGTTLADLGSGAGLPGIPLAVLAPDRQFLLVDANGKKARFLREAVRRLELTNVRVAECRVEEAAGSFDCICTRAFASLAEMLAWGGRLLAPDGRWLAMKGRFPQDELSAVTSGFRIDAVHALTVPGLDAERHLVVIKRTGSGLDRIDLVPQNVH